MGMYIHNSENLVGLSLSRNKAAQGGGLYVSSTSAETGLFLIQQCDVSRNIAQFSVASVNTNAKGGGIYCENSEDKEMKVSLDSVVVEDNEVLSHNDGRAGVGGGLYFKGVSLNMKYSRIVKNKAEHGAGSFMHDVNVVGTIEAMFDGNSGSQTRQSGVTVFTDSEISVTEGDKRIELLGDHAAYLYDSFVPETFIKIGSQMHQVEAKHSDEDSSRYFLDLYLPWSDASEALLTVSILQSTESELAVICKGKGGNIYGSG